MAWSPKIEAFQHWTVHHESLRGLARIKAFLNEAVKRDASRFVRES